MGEVLGVGGGRGFLGGSAVLIRGETLWWIGGSEVSDGAGAFVLALSAGRQFDWIAQHES